MSLRESSEELPRRTRYLPAALGLRPGTPLSRLATKGRQSQLLIAADQSYLDRDPGVVIVVESLGD